MPAFRIRTAAHLTITLRSGRAADAQTCPFTVNTRTLVHQGSPHFRCISRTFRTLDNRKRASDDCRHNQDEDHPFREGTSLTTEVSANK
jgi:hypothetical protein